MSEIIEESQLKKNLNEINLAKEKKAENSPAFIPKIIEKLPVNCLVSR
jgi:hypothetical protein